MATSQTAETNAVVYLSGRNSATAPASDSAQKSGQIFVFPAACTPIIGKLPFATIKFFRMNTPAIPGNNFVRHDRVKHLVIQHVPQEPQRHKWLIQRRI